VTTRLITRPPVKQDGIVDDLRRSILARRLAPGARLPTRTELQERFAVSSVTVQRALDRLIADGFVVARGRQGTFVAERPPHASRYALVFPLSPGAPGWVRFWTALGNEALAARRTDSWNISSFYDVDGRPDSPDYRNLVGQIRDHRLAGLIFAAHPFNLGHTPLLDDPELPRIAIMDAGGDQRLAALSLSAGSFLAKALDHFQARGRRRFALIGVPGHTGAFQKELHAGLAARGLSTRPYWLHGVSPAAAEGARQIAHLLMAAAPGDRPDALLVSDDNLVEHVTAGLVAAGVAVPGDLEVVAHCNFPWAVPSVLPMRRLGFDAREVLRACVDAIDRQRHGGPTRERVEVAARFEEEVEGEGPAVRQSGSPAVLST
jgi:hypothetical protein